MYKPLPRTVFTITVRGTKKRKDHDCNIDGQAQCGKRDSKNSGRTDQGKRIYDRKRIHGDMAFGNMLSLAMPKDYGIERPEREDFPLNPAPSN